MARRLTTLMLFLALESKTFLNAGTRLLRAVPFLIVGTLHSTAIRILFSVLVVVGLQSFLTTAEELDVNLEDDPEEDETELDDAWEGTPAVFPENTTRSPDITS